MANAYSLQYSGWMRNYKAMGDTKLNNALRELEGQYGDAYRRVQDHGAYVDEHIAEARAEARRRGLVVSDEVPKEMPTAADKSGKPLTEAKECSDCGKKKRHYVDDYICQSCRDALDSPQEKQTKVDTEIEVIAHQAFDENLGGHPSVEELQRQLVEALNKQ